MKCEGMNWFKSIWKAFNTPLVHEKAEASRLKNFTPRAQQVLALARKEADRMHHNFVGTEHVLLGIIKLGHGTAVTVLDKLGIDPETARREVEKLVGTGTDYTVIRHIPYTPRVKKVLALAIKEAAALNHTYVGTEHILLGLLREGDGIAARVLTDVGLNLEATRQQVLKVLDPNYEPPDVSRKKAKPEAEPEAIDISKHYDVYCREGEREMIYRNARFKGLRTLFKKKEFDVLSDDMELEQEDGQTIFIGRMSVIKFHEHVKTPPSAG